MAATKLNFRKSNVEAIASKLTIVTASKEGGCVRLSSKEDNRVGMCFKQHIPVEGVRNTDVVGAAPMGRTAYPVIWQDVDFFIEHKLLVFNEDEETIDFHPNAQANLDKLGWNARIVYSNYKPAGRKHGEFAVGKDGEVLLHPETNTPFYIGYAVIKGKAVIKTDFVAWDELSKDDKDAYALAGYELSEGVEDETVIGSFID